MERRQGTLIDYQFDGITVGYKITDNMIWRLCWGLGYESGFGNGNLLKLPQDRLKVAISWEPIWTFGVRKPLCCKLPTPTFST